MRNSHLITSVGVFALAAMTAACRSDKITATTRPALAGVRYVHAVSDTGRLDFRMVDQIGYSANTIDSAGGIRYRQASRYFPTEAKARHINVFNYFGTDRSIPVVSTVMVDTTIAFVAGKNYTLLLVGSARAAAGTAGRMHFVLIDDTPPAVDTNVVHVRVVNANTTGSVDAYLVSTSSTAPSGTPAFAAVAPGATSSYVARPIGPLAVRVATAGTTTFSDSLSNVAGLGTPGTSTVNPVAGSGRGGTAFSVYVFAAAVTGSGAFVGIPTSSPAQGVFPAIPLATMFRVRSAELFVDRLPPNTVPATGQ